MATAGGFIVLALLPALASAAGNEPTEIWPAGVWEDLGPQVRLSRVYSQAVGRDALGREVYYLGFTDAERAFVLALDPMTGEGKQSDLTGFPGQVWHICAHTNGKAYATTGGGGIFELAAAAGEVRLLGRPPQGETVVWELHEASDGNLYGGTYPNAKLARANLASGQIEDLGRMDPDQMYVRTIATKGDYVYCGGGVTRPSVWAYNIRTGEKRQLLPDEAHEGPGWGRAMTRIDGEVYIYGNGRLYFRVSGLDLEQVEEMPRLPFHELSDATRLFTGERSGPDGVYWAHTPAGEKHEIHLGYECTGTKLWDIFEGPDGRIYGNTHTPITLFAFDPATCETEVLGNPVGHAGQIYASLWHGGKLHMAAYSDCTYTVWDPAKPWNFGEAPDSNPRRLGYTSRHIQRAGSMIVAPDGQYIIVGGIQGYGRVGAGLVVVDPDKPHLDVIEKPVGDQSPWALATTPDASVIVIGTSMYGGTGTKRVLTPGRLVFWEGRERKTVGELTPWEDEWGIASLLRIAGELFVCGAPNGKVAVYDFEQERIVRQADWAYGAGRLLLRPQDGMLYAAMRGRVVRFDPATLEHEVLATHPGLHGAISLAGHYLYGFANASLLRLGLN